MVYNKHVEREREPPRDRAIPAEGSALATCLSGQKPRRAFPKRKLSGARIIIASAPIIAVKISRRN